MSIGAIFAVVVGSEQAIRSPRTRTARAGAVQALWAIHNSVFTVLDLSIAVALIGLLPGRRRRRDHAAGLRPGSPRSAAALLLVGTLTGPATAAGDTMAFFAITVVGFLIWLAFLIVTGVRLIRTAVPA